MASYHTQNITADNVKSRANQKGGGIGKGHEVTYMKGRRGRDKAPGCIGRCRPAIEQLRKSSRIKIASTHPLYQTAKAWAMDFRGGGESGREGGEEKEGGERERWGKEGG